MQKGKPIILSGHMDPINCYLGEAHVSISEWVDTIEFHKEDRLASLVGSNTILLISVCQFVEHEREIVRRAEKAGLAVLIIADGILEYRIPGCSRPSHSE